VRNLPRKTSELPTYREVRHLTASRNLIDGNDEFAAGLGLAEKMVDKPSLSGLGVRSRAGIPFQGHLHGVL
jgi:hypothetical protein